MERNLMTFQGPGPFDLPVAQAAAADPRGSHIALSFKVQISPSRVAVVRIAVLSSQARPLATAILDAASKVDGTKKKASRPPK